MSKILLIVAAVLLLGSAGLSFLNKGKMTAKSTDLARQTSVAAAAQADAGRTKAALKDSEKKASEAAAKATELDAKLASTIVDLNKAKEDADAAAKKLTEKETELAQAQAAPKPSAAPVAAVSPDADVVAKLTAEVAELKTVNDTLQNRAKGLEGQITQFQQEKNMRLANIVRPGLTGKVLAVDRNWNFVVLSLGDRNGVNNNVTMVVRRGENMVGRVRITSVEPSQSIADIVPNSVPPGVSVQAGDTVIFPGGS